MTVSNVFFRYITSGSFKFYYDYRIDVLFQFNEKNFAKFLENWNLRNKNQD